MRHITRLRRAWQWFWLSRAGESMELIALAGFLYLLLHIAEWLVPLVLAAHGLWHIWTYRAMTYRRYHGRRILIKESKMKFSQHVKNFLTRPRAWFLWLGLLVAVAVSWLTAPETGLVTVPRPWSDIVAGFVALAQVLWAIGLAHWARKALSPYIKLEAFAKKALEHPIAAALVVLAQAIMYVGLLLAIAPRAHAADLPPGFAQHGPTLKAEQQRYWPDHPNPVLLAALVEQESCVSLKSPRCWNPRAQLKTQREEGAGMGQVTRAYRADGSLRFDALASLTTQYSQELQGWTWGNVYQRPDMQLRALVLMSRDAARPFRAMSGMLAFGDAAYNGGPGDVQRERRACGLTPGCDASLWFGNVELHCQKSRQPIYGGRSACDINREHVRNVMLVRAAKYTAAWAAL